MQSKTTAQIQDAAKNVPRNGSFPPAFVPVIDDQVVFEDLQRPRGKGAVPQSGSYVHRTLDRRLRSQPYIIGSNDKELGPQETMADAEFTCPSAHVSNSRAKAGVPVWRYRFFGGGPTEAGSAGIAGLMSAASSYHGSELPYVFGGVQAPASLLSRPSPLKTAVSKQFMEVWAAFAKDPAKGPLQHGWPLYNAKGMPHAFRGRTELTRPQATRWSGCTTSRRRSTASSAGTSTMGGAAWTCARTPNNYSSAPGLDGLEALGKLGNLGKDIGKLGDLMKSFGFGKLMGKQGAKNAMV